MKFVTHTLLILVFALLLQLFLPWWTMAVAAFIISFLMNEKSFMSFIAGFLGVGLLWLALAFYIDFTTASILTEKLNRLLPLNSLLMTFVIGALVGGFASLTGALFRKL